MFQMLIVAGGESGGAPLASTELLTYGSDRWRQAGALPLPASRINGASIGNIFHVVGGYDGTATRRTEILSWDGAMEAWAEVGHLTTPRSSAGVTEVPASAVQEFCSKFE